MNQTKEELIEEAVRAALNNNWDEAISVNRLILNDNPNDIETYNRLGKAYSQQNNIKEARKTYRQVLKFDPYNLIAQKNLKALQLKTSPSTLNRIDPNLFLEEPGKTKTITIEVSNPENLRNINIGDALKLILGKDIISLATQQDLVIGAFDNEFSKYLIKLIKVGNKYNAHVFSLDNNHIGIFLREFKHSQKLDDFVSFPTAGSRQYRSFLKEDLLSLISEQVEIESLHEDDYQEKGRLEEEPIPDEDGVKLDADTQNNDDNEPDNDDVETTSSPG
jgi:hypothetical protein